MAEILIQNETETGRGWSYEVFVRDENASTGGGSTDHRDAHRVTLSWADYEYWSHGQKPPADVVRTVVAFLLEQQGFALPGKFDASTARRWFPSLDRHFQGEVG